MAKGTETLGERVRKHREALGWSQRKLALKASSFNEDRSLSNVTINNIENGKTLAPGVDVLAAIAGALNVGVGDLLDAREIALPPLREEELVRQLGRIMPDVAEDQISQFARDLSALTPADQELLRRVANRFSRERNA